MARTAAHRLSRAAGAGLDAAHAARSLHELLAQGPDAVRADMEEGVFALWRERLGAEGHDRRLAWSPPDGALADETWRETLQEALAKTDAPAPGSDPAAPLPFEEVLAPFVAVAEAELDTVARCAGAALSPGARAGWRRSLAAVLSHLALPVLSSEFSLRQALNGRLSWLMQSGGTGDYAAFVAEMQQGGLRALLADYPALGRLLAEAARNAARNGAELLIRFQDDRPDLQRTLGLLPGAMQIEILQPLASDPHDGGASVAILHLAQGYAVVAKPRPIDMEAGLARLLDWANAAGFPWPFRRVGLLARDGYGWMEHVAAAPCTDKAMVRRFYARSGGLFCLWWLLQGVDLHHENVIAAGENPVIVDAETLLHPRPPTDLRETLGPGARYGAADGGSDFDIALRESGFLPVDGALDLSAWGAGGAVETPFPVLGWSAVNSDAMTVRREAYRAAARPNLPILAGVPVQPADYADGIVEGFRAMYGGVLQERAGFLAVLESFAGARGRFIARSTNVYGLLLNASLQPERLRAGSARGVVFEELRRQAVTSPERPAAWPLLDAELAALECFDVPRFETRCDEPTALWPAPLGQARARVAALSEAGLDLCAAALARALGGLPRRPVPPAQALEGASPWPTRTPSAPCSTPSPAAPPPM